ncbi:MAG: cytochrome P450, partial [Gammaproteobacteria bacterium]|nr:cytochrome P450 [Gammaproteobacteria bacterium]
VKSSPIDAPGPDGSVAIVVVPAALPTLRNLREQFGDVVGFAAPNGRRALFVNDPDAVRRLLVRQHPKYRKGKGFERVEMLLGNGLIVSNGDVWRRSRTMIQPSFSRQNIHQLIELMIECTARKVDAWQDIANSGTPLNVTQEMSDFALELILRAIFGPQYDSHIVADGDNPFAFLSQDATRDLSVVMKLRRLRELLLTIIAQRRAHPEEGRYDFLSMYLTATDKSGTPFTDRELLDELMTLIVAGYETSAGTLNWCWYLLAHHPDVQEKVAAEAQAFGADFATADDPSLSGMPWTQLVLDETLRLYPPVWLFSRRALEDDVLLDYRIPDGADLYISPLIMQRTADFWEKPDAFRPERIGADGRYKKGDRPFIPFSLGPRRCLGEYFSFLEMKIHLGMLVQRFRMVPGDDDHPGLNLGINLRSNTDILLKLENR